MREKQRGMRVVSECINSGKFGKFDLFSGEPERETVKDRRGHWEKSFSPHRFHDYTLAISLLAICRVVLIWRIGVIVEKNSKSTSLTRTWVLCLATTDVGFIFGFNTVTHEFFQEVEGRGIVDEHPKIWSSPRKRRKRVNRGAQFEECTLQ